MVCVCMCGSYSVVGVGSQMAHSPYIYVMCNHVIFAPCTDRGDMKHVVQSFFLSENALTFTAPATKSIQILGDHKDDDVGFEEPEYYELALVAVPDSPQIVFDPAIANVNILDDEGNDITLPNFNYI